MAKKIDPIIQKAKDRIKRGWKNKDKKNLHPESRTYFDANENGDRTRKGVYKFKHHVDEKKFKINVLGAVTFLK